MKHGYIAIYRRMKHEVYADSLWQAQVKAEEFFRPSKSQRHMISVMLAEKDGKPIEHVADF